MNRGTLHIAAGCMFVLVAACQRENPVQLLDNDLQSEGLRVENTPLVNEPFDPPSNDSTGFFVIPQKSFSGNMIVEGSEYDGPNFHHESSLARVKLFDRSMPIVLYGDTLGYWTLDAGVVTIDNLPLSPRTQRFTSPALTIDSVGIQYSLFNNDGAGGKGFQYFGSHQYTWDVGGTRTVPSIQLSVLSPRKLHVSVPTPADTISLLKDFVARWEGGGDVVRIIISDIANGERPRVLIHARLGINRGKVTIPVRILRLLPANRSRLLFTFASSTETNIRLAGFQSEVHLQTETSHKLLLNVIH